MSSAVQITEYPDEGYCLCSSDFFFLKRDPHKKKHLHLPSSPPHSFSLIMDSRLKNCYVIRYDNSCTIDNHIIAGSVQPGIGRQLDMETLVAQHYPTGTGVFANDDDEWADLEADIEMVRRNSQDSQERHNDRVSNHIICLTLSPLMGNMIIYVKIACRTMTVTRMLVCNA